MISGKRGKFRCERGRRLSSLRLLSMPWLRRASDSAGPGLAKTKLSFDAFLMQLRKPANQMPPYEAMVLPDDKAADIDLISRVCPAQSLIIGVVKVISVSDRPGL